MLERNAHLNYFEATVLFYVKGQIHLGSCCRNNGTVSERQKVWEGGIFLFSFLVLVAFARQEKLSSVGLIPRWLWKDWVDFGYLGCIKLVQAHRTIRSQSESNRFHEGSSRCTRNVLWVEFWPSINQAVIKTGTVGHSADVMGFVHFHVYDYLVYFPNKVVCHFIFCKILLSS